MIKVTNKCTACMACLNVCKHNAIVEVEDSKGFLIPSIVADKCVDCGLCDKVCNMHNVHESPNSVRSVYSLVINDKHDLFHSTSGGAFTALSDVVLSKGGVIVGSILDNDFTVKHIVTDSVDGRNKMRGSKYVQSNAGFTYREVKNYLQQGREVMFVGAPCQVAALQSYLGKTYNNLVLVDFLCHGVPNNKMFKDHIAYMEKLHGSKVVDYLFRGKRYTAAAAVQSYRLKGDKVKASLQGQAFYSFFASMSLRESCFECNYRSSHRYGDVTIADFWGIEELTGEKSAMGTSLVLVNSEKGEAIFAEARHNCKVREFPFDSIASKFKPASNKNKQRREVFWKTYIDEGYEALVAKYFRPSIYRKIRFVVKKIVKTNKARKDFGRELCK